MVAPSFQSFEIIGEVFIKGAKPYVKVKNPKTGTVRDVRWYNEAEFAKAYGKKIETNAKVPGDGIDAAWEFYWSEEGFDGLKHARGFDNGPILVLRGVRTREDEEWCEKSIARYAVGIGWHFVSTDILPDDVPEHFKMVLLGWNEFRDGDDRHSKRPSQLAEIISKKVREKQFVKFK